MFPTQSLCINTFREQVLEPYLCLKLQAQYQWSCADITRVDGQQAACSLLSPPTMGSNVRLPISNLELLEAGITDKDRVTFVLTSSFEGQSAQAVDKQVCAMSARHGNYFILNSCLSHICTFANQYKCRRLATLGHLYTPPCLVPVYRASDSINNWCCDC